MLKTKIVTWLKQNEYQNIYLLIGLVFAGSYYFVRRFITDQSAWSIVKVAPLTINMLLCYFLWGFYAEKRWKGRKQWVRLAYDFAGFIVISLVFRFGFDMKSIVG